ncbi:succinate:quinone oxidoreductase subunit C [Aspergillus ibericus CBS 121593]|uniref:Putative cytochrome b subunit of succinate dehydrogenase n=1 Tax=Aspergillus ibericus CBS 121593 TaxID=1448316 RepID=A0A395HB82_9EURO|nr:putative cytochrome b subunit of succinate dehydrogenase [Aspergillus ibericus CBS 121593]RAL05201.1 putative cytochrome b subunit of succinate dehydrogenase [Aspergillus ibericus CBS 121593]
MFSLRRAAVASSPITPIMSLAWQQQVRMQTTKSVTTPLRVITAKSAQEELARQRLRRPVAPHLSIYKWQVHSVSSAMERNTGLLLAGGLYLFGTSYLVAPWLGWDLSSAVLVTAFGSLPVAAKLVLKFFVAWPFTFHLFNGIRYIVASTGYTLDSKSQFIKIAWAVVGSSALAAVGLVAYV